MKTSTTPCLWSIGLKNIFTVAPHLIYKVHTLVIVIFGLFGLIIVMQTDLWERESLCVRERLSFYLWLSLNLPGSHPSILPSILPSLPPHCLRPGPILGLVCWTKRQKNPGQFLSLGSLYTNLFGIFHSKPKMGLLGAVGFSLALASLIQVKVLIFYSCVYLWIQSSTISTFIYRKQL